MKLTEVANVLRKQGHTVTLYKRPDGGYRVSSIDGLKFSIGGNAGNDYARNLLGASLSRKQYEQREKARPLALAGKQDTKMTFINWRKSKRKGGKAVKETVKKKGPRPQSLTPRKGDTPEERREKNRIRRMRAKLKKKGVETSARILRKRLKYDNLSGVTKLLSNKSRKSAGLAYSANVLKVLEFAEMLLSYDSSESARLFYEGISSTLYQWSNSMMDHSVVEMNEALYDALKRLRDGYPVDWEILASDVLTIAVDGHNEALSVAGEWGIDLDA